VALAVASFANAATISVGSSLTTGTTQISQGTGGGALSSSYNFTDNGGPPGQTFTATSNFLMTSFTIQGAGDTSSTFGGSPNSWRIQIGSVNTTTNAITQLAGETATTDSSVANFGSSYLTFTLATPIALTAGQMYSFSLITGTGTGGGYYGLARTADNSSPYSGGSAFNNNISPNENQAPGSGSTADPVRRNFNGFVDNVPNSYDYVFAINGTVIPEPSTTGLAAFALAGCAFFRRRA